MPAELERIVDKALEKDRGLRYQSASELKTDLMRLKRDPDSGGRLRGSQRPRGGAAAPAERSVAVLYFENLSGVKEDEYFRDGMTEDVITELSKISGSESSRPAVLGVPRQTGRRRPRSASSWTPPTSRGQPAPRRQPPAHQRAAGRPRTGSPWAERYDREIEDVFAVQDEIARTIAQALRVTLSPQEHRRSRQADREPAGLRLLPPRPHYARRKRTSNSRCRCSRRHQARPRFALAHAAISKLFASTLHR